MKQTRTDTSIALMQAIGLHLLLFALLFAGLKLSRDVPMQAAQGDPIEADLATASDLSAQMQRALQRKPVEQALAPVPVGSIWPSDATVTKKYCFADKSWPASSEIACVS